MSTTATATDGRIVFEPEGLVVSYGLAEEDGYSVAVTDRDGAPTDFVETDLAGDEDHAIVTLVSKSRDARLIVMIAGAEATSASFTTPVPPPAPGPLLSRLPVEVTLTVEARVEYDAASGALSLVRPSGCCDLDDADEVLGRWTRDVVDSGALVRRLPVGQVVVEVDGADRPEESAVRRLLALGRLVREGEPWAVYGGRRFRAVRVVTD